MDGVLNETTQKVHRQKTGAAALRTTCGLAHHVDPDRLRVVTVERVTTETKATRCGGCFEDAGGY
ncbi:MAG: hypothetical protein ABEH66_02875 [Halobacteriales archaeon]